MKPVTRKKRHLIRRRVRLQRSRSWFRKHDCPCGGQDAIHWVMERDLRRWGMWK